MQRGLIASEHEKTTRWRLSNLMAGDEGYRFCFAKALFSASLGNRKINFSVSLVSLKRRTLRVLIPHLEPKNYKPYGLIIFWLGMRDSNPRMLGPEPSALPLGESPLDSGRATRPQNNNNLILARVKPFFKPFIFHPAYAIINILWTRKNYLRSNQQR